MIKIISFLLLNLLIGLASAQGVWTRKADFPGEGRMAAAGFCTNSKLFITTGIKNFAYYNDTWAYDPATDAWTQKADFAGGKRCNAVGFSIGARAYLCTGQSFDTNTYSLQNDLWEYAAATDAWSQKTNFSVGRHMAMAFATVSKGYVGTGSAGILTTNDFWAYEPVSGAWTQIASLQFSRNLGVAVIADGKGFVGLGCADGQYDLNEWKRYDTTANSWVPRLGFPGTARSGASAFSIGTFVYVGLGVDNSTGEIFNDFWRYDITSDTWMQAEDFPGPARAQAVSFSLNNKGYVGTGGGAQGSAGLNDFWEYTLTSTGLKELDKKHFFSVSPNPFSSEAVLQTDIVLENATLTIYNSNGEVVKQWKHINGHEIGLNRAGLKSGLYMAELVQENLKFQSYKLIITED